MLASLAVPATAQAQLTVTGQLIQERLAAPGEAYGGVIRVRNTTGDPQIAHLYQTDYIRAADGTSRYDDPGSVARSNGRWITVSARTVIPPNQAMDIPYNVAVPSALHAFGTHWSVIMVEALPAPPPRTAVSPGKPADVQVGITSRFRTAVQILTHVGTQGTRNATFETPHFFAIGDTTRVLQFDIRNTGELSFRPTYKLDLYREDGSHVTRLTAVGSLTYPGLATRQRFELRRLPTLPYRAIVTADIGDGSVIGARYSFTP